MTRISYAVEGWSDEPVAEQIIIAAGKEPWHRYTAGGKSRLDPKLTGYNRSALRQPWLVLRDLDDANCPSELIRDLLEDEVSHGLAIRIPVRSLEAWVLADRETFAGHFCVPVGRVPVDTELLRDPKSALVDVCRHSSSSAVRVGMVPTARSGRKVGREYGAMIREYLKTSWRLDVAAETAPSLERTLIRVKQLVDNGHW